VNYDVSASVVNVGTPSSAILNFSLPRGFNGNNGISMLYVNQWNAATTYIVNNVVYYANLGQSYVCISGNVGTVPTNSTYWALIVQKGDTGPQGQKGDKGDSNTMAAAIVGGLTGAAAGIAAGLFTNLVKWVDNIFGSTRRDPTDEEIITEMMNQMEEDIASLKARMTQAEANISTLQNNMTTQQDKTQYINTYTDALFNSITNFSSAITTTNGLFGESSRISQNGTTSFPSVQTGTINTPYNTLRVNGNTTINGLLYYKKTNGVYTVGGQWDF
jgi:roadblock/LC7 domain-containing protein